MIIWRLFYPQLYFLVLVKRPRHLTNATRIIFTWLSFWDRQSGMVSNSFNWVRPCICHRILNCNMSYKNQFCLYHIIYIVRHPACTDKGLVACKETTIEETRGQKRITVYGNHPHLSAPIAVFRLFLAIFLPTISQKVQALIGFGWDRALITT